MSDLDKILQYTLDADPKLGYVTTSWISENLFSDLNKDQVNLLLDKIADHKPQVATIIERRYEWAIKSNGLTKDFLDKGGFTKIESDLKSASDFEKEKERIEFEKSKIDLELAKETLKEFPKTKKRAKVAYIIAIILAVLQLAEWIVSLLSSD